MPVVDPSLWDHNVVDDLQRGCPRGIVHVIFTAHVCFNKPRWLGTRGRSHHVMCIMIPALLTDKHLTACRSKKSGDISVQHVQ